MQRYSKIAYQTEVLFQNIMRKIGCRQKDGQLSWLVEIMEKALHWKIAKPTKANVQSVHGKLNIYLLLALKHSTAEDKFL